MRLSPNYPRASARVPSGNDAFPILYEVLGRAPGEGLNGKRGIVGSAGSHDGSAEDTEMGHFVRERPPVHDICLGIFAHARAAVSMGGDGHRADFRSLYRNCAGSPIPL